LIDEIKKLTLNQIATGARQTSSIHPDKVNAKLSDICNSLDGWRLDDAAIVLVVGLIYLLEESGGVRYEN